MKKIGAMIVLLLSFGTLSACSTPTQKPTTKAPSTVVKANNFSVSQLQKRFDRISDVTMKPVAQAALSATESEVAASATTGLKQLDQVKLELNANTSNQDLTQKLTTYLAAGQKLLTILQQKQNDAINPALQDFYKQAASISQTYFNNALPNSIKNFSKIQQGVGATTSE